MKLFNKNPKFFVAECPKCGGALELDANYEIAHCQNCGMQYIVQNVDKKKKPKRSKFEMVMEFVERERYLKRKDRIEREKQEIQEKEKQEKQSAKIAIICGVILAIMLFSMILLGSLGILD